MNICCCSDKKAELKASKTIDGSYSLNQNVFIFYEVNQHLKKYNINDRWRFSIDAIEQGSIL